MCNFFSSRILIVGPSKDINKKAFLVDNALIISLCTNRN